MQMVAGRSAGCSLVSNDLPCFHLFPNLHQQIVHVHVLRGDAVAMVDLYVVSRAAVVPCNGNLPCVCCKNRLVIRAVGQVDTVVHGFDFGDRVYPHPKRACDILGVNGFVHQFESHGFFSFRVSNSAAISGGNFSITFARKWYVSAWPICPSQLSTDLTMCVLVLLSLLYALMVFCIFFTLRRRTFR
jgi:hypothetical protein